MPTVPPTEPSDWYIVVPQPDASSGAVSVPVFVIGANDMDEAAQWAHDHGYPVAAVVLATRYKAS